MLYIEIACRCAEPEEDETYCCLGEEFSSLCSLHCGTCYDIDTDCTKGPCDSQVIGCESTLCTPGFICVEDEDENGECVQSATIPNCGGLEGCARYLYVITFAIVNIYHFLPFHA